MLEKEFGPLAVEIEVSDFNKSLNFYKEILEFEPIRIETDLKFASFNFNGALFMIQEEKDVEKRKSGARIRFIIADVEKYYSLVKGRGVTITKPLETIDYGLKRFYLEDPDGYKLKFGSRIA